MPIDEHFLQIQATKFFTYGVLPELLRKWYSRLPDYTITGDLIPGSSGHTLLSSLSSNLFDAQSSIRTLLLIGVIRRQCCNKKNTIRNVKVTCEQD